MLTLHGLAWSRKWSSMPTRKQFTDLARGIAGRYVSRYNDIGGRWGIGVLTESLHESGKTEVIYDLASPSEPFIRTQAQWLNKRMSQERIPLTWMESCTLRIAVVRNSTPPVDSQTRDAWAAGTAVHEVSVTVAVTDDRGRVWSASDVVWAWDASVHPPRECPGTA